MLPTPMKVIFLMGFTAADSVCSVLWDGDDAASRPRRFRYL